MGICIKLDHRDEVSSYACWAPLFNILGYHQGEYPDDYDEEYDDLSDYLPDWGNSFTFVGCTAKTDHRRDATFIEAYVTMMRWFTTKYEVPFLDVPWTDAMAEFLARGVGPASLRINHSAVTDDESSHLPLFCHLIRLPYVKPRVITVWGALVGAGASEEDALVLACNAKLRCREGMDDNDAWLSTDVHMVGWCSRDLNNGDVNAPFSGNEYTGLAHIDKFNPVPHDDAFSLSEYLVDNTQKCDALNTQATSHQLRALRPEWSATIPDIDALVCDSPWPRELSRTSIAAASVMLRDRGDCVMPTISHRGTGEMLSLVQAALVIKGDTL